MMKIGTHDTLTCYKGKGIISKLVTVFAKCQSKSLTEQYDAGARYFDFRAIYDKKLKTYIAAHGIWKSNISIREAVRTLNNYIKGDEFCYISITLEKGIVDDEFVAYVEDIRQTFNKAIVCEINQKKPKWINIKRYDSVVTHQCFLALDGRSWHTYLPIPWLWNKLYRNKFVPKENAYNLYDFL